MITIIAISLSVFISLAAAYFLFLILSNETIVNKQSYLTITNKTLSYDVFECKRTILVNWIITSIVTSNFSNKEQRIVNLIIILDPNHDTSL